MKEIIINNLTSIFTLSGVIVGALINNIFNRDLKVRETKLLVTKTIIDKRMNSYEQIIGISKILRTVVSTYKTDDNSNLITYPRGMEDNESFQILFKGVVNAINDGSHWIDIETTRELGFMQDYLASLSRYVKQVEDNKDSLISIKELGLVIKQDFIDLSGSLEDKIFKSYPDNLINLKTTKSSKWHKYKKEATKKRFEQTLLFSKEEEILSKIDNSKK